MKRLQILVLAAVVAALMLAVPGAAFAESQQGSKWSVTYTSGGQLNDDFSQQGYADDISGLQPGDDITFTVTLNHENEKTADWYMSNEVIKSLEAGKAEGSAYEYLLTYSGASSNASRTLYDSQAVGGDNTSGLKEATEAGGLEDFFFLENLSKGKSATVTLKVTLDGETEGNDYFDTIARLKMQFGVDPSKSNDNPPNNNVVRTGDETNLFPFYVVMAVSGLALLVIAIAMVRRRRADQTGGSHAR
ncbi:MAG: hypothetical protein IJI68_06480 [Eggerthellaceae bacterium]|nr:hypothetical protein [Eggerthellaceae bacterium]